MYNPKLHIALPLMDESETIHKLMESVLMQTISDFIIYVCVNQPDSWWADPIRKNICISNQNTLSYLNSMDCENMVVIDRSSPGKGWIPPQGGAGWARKIIFDRILEDAYDDDLIISLDGDVDFGNRYFESVLNRFSKAGKKFSVLSVPYYHKLTGIESIDRALLRYEIYMRYYLINMFRIGSPYAFTALGSAMAIPVWACRSVSGITPVKNGEDFYFLQKLSKYRKILCWNSEKVYPSARVSERVDFGTGPAIQAGLKGNWESYPLYDYSSFDKVHQTYEKFPELFKVDVLCPMSEFLQKKFRTDDFWGPLRKNYNDMQRFIHACHCRIDGLRILQFLRYDFKSENGNDESRLLKFLNTFYSSDFTDFLKGADKFSFQNSSVRELNQLRDLLADKEDKLRIEFDEKNITKNGK